MGTYFSKTTEEFLFFYYTSHTFLFFCIAGKDIKIKWHSKSKVSVTTWDIMDTRIKLLQAAGSPYSAEKSSLPLCHFAIVNSQTSFPNWQVSKMWPSNTLLKGEKIYAWSLRTELMVLLPVNPLRYLLNAKEGVEKIPAQIFQRTA